MKIRTSDRIITDTHFVCEVCEYSDTDMKKVKACEKSHKCVHDLAIDFDTDTYLFDIQCTKCHASCTLNTSSIEDMLQAEFGVVSMLERIGVELKAHHC